MNEETLSFLIKEWYLQEAEMRDHYNIKLVDAKIELEKELGRKPEWHEKLARYFFNLWKETCPNEYYQPVEYNNPRYRSTGY